MQYSIRIYKIKCSVFDVQVQYKDIGSKKDYMKGKIINE